MHRGDLTRKQHLWLYASSHPKMPAQENLALMKSDCNVQILLHRWHNMVVSIAYDTSLVMWCPAAGMFVARQCQQMDHQCPFCTNNKLPVMTENVVGTEGHGQPIHCLAFT